MKKWETDPVCSFGGLAAVRSMPVWVQRQWIQTNRQETSRNLKDKLLKD